MLRRSGRSAGIAPSAQTGPYHSLEIVCSNTPRKNNDPRRSRVQKQENALHLTAAAQVCRTAINEVDVIFVAFTFTQVMRLLLERHRQQRSGGCCEEAQEDYTTRRVKGEQH